MCWPVALMYASTVVSSYAAYAGTMAQKNAAEYNQKVGKAQAADALVRGDAAEADYARQVRQLQGRQHAALAANGVRLDAGSPLAILADTYETGTADLATIRDNTKREAWGFQAQAGLAGYQARTTNPLLAGTTTLLGGAAQTAGYVKKYGWSG